MNQKDLETFEHQELEDIEKYQKDNPTKNDIHMTNYRASLDVLLTDGSFFPKEIRLVSALSVQGVLNTVTFCFPEMQPNVIYSISIEKL